MAFSYFLVVFFIYLLLCLTALGQPIIAIFEEQGSDLWQQQLHAITQSGSQSVVTNDFSLERCKHYSTDILSSQVVVLIDL